MRRALRWIGLGMLGLVVLVPVVAVTGIAVLELVGWNALRGPIAALVAQRTGRSFAIEGDLDVDLGPAPRLTARAVTLGNPDWVGGERPLLRTREFELVLDLWPLLRGEVVLPRLALRGPEAYLVRGASGTASWDFGGGGGKRGAPPRIRELVLEDGRVVLDDAQHHTRLRARVASTNRLDAPLADQLRLTGAGSFNGGPFRLDATAGSLFAFAGQKAPYPLRLDLRAGASRLRFDGRIADLGNLDGIDARLALSGPDAAQLYSLLGVALPNTPPYAVSGRLLREGKTIRFTGLTGKVGDSDLAGEMRFVTGGERLRLSADLRSRRLDFDDLGTLIGAPPAIGRGETASAQQKALATTLAGEQRLFPDAPLAVDRLRAMDADVRYRAQSVQARALPLEDVRLGLRLDDGVLRLEPASFSFPQGVIELWLTLDGTRQPAVSDYDLRIKALRLDEAMPALRGTPALEGVLQGRAQLTARGNSAREAAAGANGRIGLVMEAGRMSHLIVELAGLDVAEALGVLIRKGETVNVRCAAAALEVTDGVITPRSFLVDTDDSIITVAGKVNLADERLDLTLKTHSKGPSVLAGQAPVTLRGPLRKPGVGVKAGSLAGRGAAAVALGALLTPLAAILAFVDPGLARDSDCIRLLDEARRSADGPAPRQKR